MSLASDIITGAYRESNLVPLVSTPSANEVTEGLARLNSLILSTLGNEAGSELCDINVGGEFDQSTFFTFVPANSRLVLNLGTARTMTLDPQPYEGQRVAIADASGNLATRNLTLDGNGRQIEGSASNLVLATNSLSRQWMYRADTGNWVRVSSLSAGDEMPFPADFDDYFIVSLALRLNPRHSATLSQESAAALQRSKSQIRARYRRPRPLQDMGTLRLLNSSATYPSRAFNPLLP